MSHHGGQADQSQRLSGDASNLPVENVQQRVNFGDACIALVQDYRQGTRGRADSVQQLSHIVCEEQARVSPEQAEQVSDDFSAYFDMLENFDSKRVRVAREASTLDEDQKGASEVGEGDGLAPTVSDDSDGNQPAKRAINDDLIPFRKEDVVNLPSDLAKALKMQENYAYDPGHAKSRLLRDSHRPDFPTAHWGDVIANTSTRSLTRTSPLTDSSKARPASRRHPNCLRLEQGRTIDLVFRRVSCME